MKQEVKDELDLRRKLVVLEFIGASWNISKGWKEFDIPRSSFYSWKKKYDSGGIEELRRKMPIPKSYLEQQMNLSRDSIIEIWMLRITKRS